MKLERVKNENTVFKGVVIKEEVLATETFNCKMSGIGVERIFPVNLPALQKLKSTKKVQFVELEFSTQRTYW
jgi:ribosomal protein L19